MPPPSWIKKSLEAVRKLFVILLVLIAPFRAVVAQPLSESYYRENPSWLDAELWASDGDYFAPRLEVQTPSFEQFSIYGFGFVDYSFRGEPVGSLTTRLGRVDLRSPLERYPDYGLLSLLRRIPSTRHYHPTISPNGVGADVRTEVITTSPLEIEEGSRLRVQLSSRSYRLGLGYRLTHRRGDSVAYSLALGGRWGNDGAVEGLFCNEEYVWLSGQRRWLWKSGVESSLEVALMVAPQERSQRSWNSEEVLDLAGDGCYNSLWGWQNGRVRSSRVRREIIPTLYAAWNLDDGLLLSNVNITTLVRGGRRSRSSLEWNGAPNPTPDYWAWLPSGQRDPEVELLAREVWLEDDERYTQIDWHRLYDINRLSASSGAHYLLMDERRDMFSASVDASAGLLGVGGLRVGLRGGVHRAHDYNTPLDMLGAERVGEGFDLYDYHLQHSSWQLYGQRSAPTSWGVLFGAAEVGSEHIAYRSAQLLRGTQNSFLTLALKGGWSGTLGGPWRVGALGRYSLSAPFVEELYGAPEGQMTTNPYATSVGDWRAEGWCEAAFEKVRISMRLYADYWHRRSAVEHFWYDPTDQYVALLAGGLDGLGVGVELSARLSLAHSWTLEGHFALGRSEYLSDGVGQIVDHTTGKVVLDSSRLLLKGKSSSSSPEALGGVVVRHYTHRGWLLGAEFVAAFGRRVEPSLLLASDHLRSMATTPEEQSLLDRELSLGAASSLNVFIYRKFGSHWSTSLSVRNLLSFTGAYRGGYQPSRLIVRDGEEVRSLEPYAARYQRIYPRHAYFTISYEF